MKVQLLLSVAPFSIFPVTNELEIEVAAGTYLEQSQVKIMGASADSENQGKTVVDINLVPLGEKFDNTTATLIYQRFRHKKVPLNETVFGDYEVTHISYPGKLISFRCKFLPFFDSFQSLNFLTLLQEFLLLRQMEILLEMLQVQVLEGFQSQQTLPTKARE